MSLFCLIFLLLLLPTLLTYTLYCYETTNATGQSLFAVGKRVPRAAAGSLLSAVWLTLLFPLGLRRKLWSEPAQIVAHPKALVICVHGLFHNATAWFLYRRWLHARGYATACFSYSSWKSDLNQLENDLVAFVDLRRQQYPQRDIFLIGHSLGGVLLRMAASRLPVRTRAIVTLGAPFAGSKLAPFALNSVGRFLRFDCDAIREIAQRPFPARIRALALWSALDNMVLPCQSLRRAPDGWHEEETRPISHISMLYSYEIFLRALRWLEETEKERTAADS